MQVVREKKASAEAVRPKGSSPDPLSPEARARRQRLIAAMNASHSKEAEEAEAALGQYLDTLYPESAIASR